MFRLGGSQAESQSQGSCQVERRYVDGDVSGGRCKAEEGAMKLEARQLPIIYQRGSAYPDTALSGSADDAY